jgi:hypothetical protein
MSTRLSIANGSAKNGDSVLHRSLKASHAQRLNPALDPFDFEADLRREMEVRRVEREFVESERAAVAPALRAVPRRPAPFVEWFEALKETGPGQNDPLFPWLAERAEHRQMCWFLRQELAGEASFDDLVALTQLKLPSRPKLEMARNYWDEMGQGNESGMHGPLLHVLARELKLPEDGDVAWPALALGNLMVALATARHYAYQSIGALGVIELTAPGRAECVNAGLKRLGVAGCARRYFALHATLGVRHSQSWNREVLAPLVERMPETALPIAEGALLRLRAGQRCFECYRQQLGLS